MPTFLCVYTEQQELLSVCGYRIASQEPLFLEQYLPLHAEYMMQKQFSQPIQREKLIEFGQLASFSKGISPMHFLLITQHLIEQGFEWCIFTATDPLYAMMVRLGLTQQYFLMQIKMIFLMHKIPGEPITTRTLMSLRGI